MAHLARAERWVGSPPIAGTRGRGPPIPPAAAARGLSRRSQRSSAAARRPPKVPQEARRRGGCIDDTWQSRRARQDCIRPGTRAPPRLLSRRPRAPSTDLRRRARQGSPSARPAAAHAADGRGGRPKMRPRSCSKSARAALLGREAAPTACRPRGRLRGGGLGRAAGDARVLQARWNLKLTQPMESVELEAASPAPSAASSPAPRRALPPPPLCAIGWRN